MSAAGGESEGGGGVGERAGNGIFYTHIFDVGNFRKRPAKLPQIHAELERPVANPEMRRGKN
jgi:hypothetical protein